jgi:hypothetical protein
MSNLQIRQVALGLALAMATPAIVQPLPTSAQTASLSAGQVATVVTAAEKALGGYIFPDVGARAIARLRARLPAYQQSTDPTALVVAMNADLAATTHDKHIRVSYPNDAPAESSGPPSAAEVRAGHLQELAQNEGFRTVRRYAGNVGYLDFRGFSSDESVGATIASAMGFIANTDALIIDLRQNGGGEPSMVALLASYLFSGTVHLNDLAYRLEGSRDYDVTQVWTLPYVPGQRYVDKKVYILTSRRTFSAAEEFTYDLQALKRAIVVGEPTAGGANAGGPYRLGDHFYAAMPRAHSINAVTKTNWEGKGIKPDVEVSEADALKTARRLALQDLLENTTDPQAVSSLKQALAMLDAER